MQVKHLFTIHSVIALFNGAVIVLFPVQYMSIFGIPTLSDGAIFVSRLFGATLLTYGLVVGLARNAGPSEARRAILLGYALPIAIGFVITLQTQLSGVMNMLGWSLVALYGVMALGYGYLYFKEPEYQSAKWDSNASVRASASERD